MSRFSPIAIVSHSIAVPGAFSSRELFDHTLLQKDLLSSVAQGRWRLDPSQVLERGSGSTTDRVVTLRGGYVRGFEERFNPEGFEIEASEIVPLDRLFHLALHTAREALSQVPTREALRPRSGLVLANLSFPSASFSRYAEETWGQVDGKTDPRNRFMSGYPAWLTAQALGLGLANDAFAIDAACASSLYAIKLACDALHDHRANLMIAGAVSCADDLFIHMGFTALQALSPSGQSRPFHRDADGLIPAEGAGAVVLKRMDDALRDGDRIEGVIRGVGLSNDGRGKGLLSPSEEGQVVAMEEAYRNAALEPRDVGLLECHATGTRVGDAVEVRSTSRVFSNHRVPCASIKGNLGHLITAAGMAGLVRTLASFDHGIKAPSTLIDAQNPALDASSLRLLQAPETWPEGKPRIAAISAFGFGGNNAHLLVEAHTAPVSRGAANRTSPQSTTLAITALAVRSGSHADTASFARALMNGGETSGRTETVTLDSMGLRFPPKDLEAALPQQTLLLSAAQEALAGIALPWKRTAVYAGMGCDPEVARYGARWRATENRDDIVGPLGPSGVLGTMPNIVANRISSQWDCGGPAFSISAEELSGTRALELASRALTAREIDAAIVAAVDLSAEAIHESACGTRGADAAVVLVLERDEDARANGRPLLATLDGTVAAVSFASELERPAQSHATASLLDLARACIRNAAGCDGDSGGRVTPRLSATQRSDVTTVSRFGMGSTTRLSSADRAFADCAFTPITFDVFSGESNVDVLAQLSEPNKRTPLGLHGARLALVSTTEGRPAVIEATRDALARRAPLPPGAFLSGATRFDRTQVGFMFTGPAGAYAGMGRDLLFAFPETLDDTRAQWPSLAEDAQWVFGRSESDASITAEEKLWGAAFLAQIHASFSQRVLRLKPAAALGLSSGETNALFALGAWRDVTSLRDAIRQHEMYTRVIAGAFEATSDAWGVNAPFENWRILAPLERVREAIADIKDPRVHVTIIHTPQDVTIGGHMEACAGVVARLGAQRSRKLGYDIVIHAPELSGNAAEAWRQIHTRETFPVEGTRFYTHATLSSYAPTKETAAANLLDQAQKTLDFPALIEKAYADGVRVFVEHGPRHGCSRWISRILEGREHVAIALDHGPEVSSLQAALEAAAVLWTAGLDVDVAALNDRVNARTPSWKPARPFVLPAHPKAVSARTAKHGIAVAKPRVHVMPAPPRLSSVLPLPLPSSRKPVTPVPATPQPALPSSLPTEARILDVAASRPARGAGGIAREAFARVLAQHQEFVETQHAIHQRFLSLRAGSITGTRSVPVVDRPTPRVALGPKDAISAATATLSTPRWTRADLETHASGKISAVFGPEFAIQDGYERQVRMPEPPLLLADRVMSIEGTPLSMGRGTIVTETDVGSQTFYLHENRMPAGILIESGQADLMLISWLGVDALNKGERVYRLLGCELTYHGSLPLRGDTLRYDIHVDGHATQDRIRLFFFHYECVARDGSGAERKQLTVRGGQAGFFTDEELANTGGILWSPESDPPSNSEAVAPPPVAPQRTYTRSQVIAFTEGRVQDAFGATHLRASTHTMTPRIAPGNMRLIDEVEIVETGGGPWRRGYLRARLDLHSDDWFFKGHFKNDPCMPGTLMFEGCLQAMAFYLAACGFTLEKDAWRFEPVPERPYALRCRGQALPSSRTLIYEVFVAELLDGPQPTLVADLLCSVDGVKAFHARRLALQLTPDFPLSRTTEQAPATTALTSVRAAFDDRAILATAWGAPTRAFGDAYRAFDGPRRLSRLPSPPYKFFDRVLSFDGATGAAGAGASLVAEYDVPNATQGDDSAGWYFASNGGLMPWTVLLEAALQPCGWLALATGLPLRFEDDLYFRNLDGEATVHRNVAPGPSHLRSRVKLTNLSSSGGISLVSFDVACEDESGPILNLKTSFGFFPHEALARQVGLKPEERETEVLNGTHRPPNRDDSRFAAALPSGRLALISRYLHLDIGGGERSLGIALAEHDVDPGAWFFKAHFFQDPVQPGSLGIHMIVEALSRLAAEREAIEGRTPQRPLESLASGERTVWRYRGQVLPENQRVCVIAELTQVEQRGERRVYIGRGSLFVDGLKIYSADRLSVLA